MQTGHIRFNSAGIRLFRFVEVFPSIRGGKERISRSIEIVVNEDSCLEREIELNAVGGVNFRGEAE